MKLYKLPKHYFIHGNYMKASICDNLVEYFNNNPDRHTNGEVYGTCDEHKNELVSHPAPKRGEILFKAAEILVRDRKDDDRKI